MWTRAPRTNPGETQTQDHGQFHRRSSFGSHKSPDGEGSRDSECYSGITCFFFPSSTLGVSLSHFTSATVRVLIVCLSVLSISFTLLSFGS